MRLACFECILRSKDVPGTCSWSNTLSCGVTFMASLHLVLQWDATNRYNDIWAQYALPDMCAMRASH
jgi:hypothetical protein